MKTRHILSFVCQFLLLQSIAMAQSNEELPYKEIPGYPDSFTTGNAIARMVDGLGYRFYWATEGLTESDYEYKPSEDARSASETIDHVARMSFSILGTCRGEALEIPDYVSELSPEEQRVMTLKNYVEASTILRSLNDQQFEDRNVFFGSRSSDFPFWNLINGMISDSIYHTGQLVSFRRASGNPINPGVNVFVGKTRVQ